MRTDRLGLLLLILGIYIIAISTSRLSRDGLISTPANQQFNLHMRQTIIASSEDNQQFVCDSQGSPDVLPEGDVIRRSLHGVIIGTMKGGTQALHKTLYNSHPRILTASKANGELHYFTTQGLMRNADDSLKKLVKDENGIVNKTIPRQSMRDGWHFAVDDREAFKMGNYTKQDIMHHSNTDKFGIHSSPMYLYSGRSVPARMLCTAEWIKVICILRNPIERALSHYNFVAHFPNRGGLPPTFDEAVKDDIRSLTNHGVLRNQSDEEFASFSGSDEESLAWDKYVKRAKQGGVVAKGLYSLQLQMWVDEFKKYNKSIKDDLLVLRSEEMKEDLQGAYTQAVEFLGLDRRMTRHNVFDEEHHKTIYLHKGISNETYKLLYETFKPYNDRLSNLLGNDWNGVWDDADIESH